MGYKVYVFLLIESQSRHQFNMLVYYLVVAGDVILSVFASLIMHKMSLCLR